MALPTLSQRRHQVFLRSFLYEYKTYYDQYNIESTLKLEMADPIFITDLLSKTNTSKAAGIDKLSGTFIKDGASCFGELLTKIINFQFFQIPVK